MLPNMLLLRLNGGNVLLVTPSGFLHAQALDIVAELDDDAVMHDTVNRGGGGEWVLKHNRIPQKLNSLLARCG
jgi:hypothetical protein